MNHESIEISLRRGRVPYFNLHNKSTEKKRIKKKLIQFNNYLNTYGLSFNNIEISNQIEDDFRLEIAEVPKMYQTIKEKSAICQTARDEALMSERSYNKFRKILSPFAKLTSLKRCNAYKKILNRFWLIDNNNMGSYIKEPISKIKFVCKKYLEKISKLSPPGQVKENTFKILISGDGVNITKTNLKIINFTFSLINDANLSRRGFYTLGKFFLFLSFQSYNAKY